MPTAGGWWLNSRADPDEHNAFIFDPACCFIRAFHAGDQVQTALVDGRDRIWLGYFEEGIFDRAALQAYSPQGLLRLDDEGKIEFSYNEEIDEPFIWDMRALTIDAEDRAWFCARDDYFVASVEDGRTEQILPRAPMIEPRAMSVSESHIAFFGTIPQFSMVCMMERESRRVRLVQLRGGDGRTLNPQRITTYGGAAVMLAGNQLYQSITLRSWVRSGRGATVTAQPLPPRFNIAMKRLHIRRARLSCPGERG